MREFKFRVWESERKIFDYDPFSIWNIYAISDGGLRIIRGPEGSEWTEPTSSVLEQHTGLKDKNGVEIYEGDIIKSRFDDNYNGAVIFKDGCFEIKTNNGHTYCIGDNNVSEDFVIGNIHENPELLEDE